MPSTAEPAVREVDMQIAEKLFGARWIRWTKVPEGMPEECGRFLWDPERIAGVAGVDFVEADLSDPIAWGELRVPEYSNDNATAWQVVEKLGELGFDVVIERKGAHREYANTAEVSVRKDLHTFGHGLGTMPEAVCSAALMALALP